VSISHLLSEVMEREQKSLLSTKVSSPQPSAPTGRCRWKSSPSGGIPRNVSSESLGARVSMRQQNDGTPFRTDQGNMALDCAFGATREPAALAAQLDGRTGIVEHGLFIELATEVIVAGAHGIRHLTPQRRGDDPSAAGHRPALH
jgi:Ribose 5-phosphate isomerase A (phosphoriboisomerase A)